MRLLAGRLAILDIPDDASDRVSPAFLVAEAAWKAGSETQYANARKLVKNTFEGDYLNFLELERSGEIDFALSQIEKLLSDIKLESSLKIRLLILQTRLFRDSGQLLSASRVGIHLGHRGRCPSRL